MLQTKTVKRHTYSLLKELNSIEELSGTRLVGGTSLSLQIGHRISDDLDLLSTERIDPDVIQEAFARNHEFIPRRINANTVIGEIDGIKVDVIYHPFTWLRPPLVVDGVRLASVEDITAMKMHAIINSGKRPKDFVDLAYLSMLYSYNRMKELLLLKYPRYDPIMADRAVNYFEDVDTEMIPGITMVSALLDFDKIKKRLIKMTDEPDRVFKTPPLSKKKA